MGDLERLERTGALACHFKEYVANIIVEIYRLLGCDNDVMKLLETKQQ